MADYLDEKEARERIVDRLRRNGADKSAATTQADDSVGRTFDTLARKAGLSAAERTRKPRQE